MQVDYLIIGQGICGTMLSWFLYQEGKSFAVIDDGNAQTSSKVAAGIINPVTGRRYVTTWMIDELMPFAKQTYEAMGRYLNAGLIHHKSIIDFFPSPQMRNAFMERVKEDDSYLHPFADQNRFNAFFNYDLGCGEVQPAYVVQFGLLLALWRQKLMDKGFLHPYTFRLEDLKVATKQVRYHDITAGRLIFCDGIAGSSNPWFNLLPFAPNKGEALVIECEGLNTDFIFKRGLTLVPLQASNNFWIGSNYQWQFSDDQPSEAFFKSTVSHLRQWLKIPYKVLSHQAAIRPATLERRPFVGFHPAFPHMGILNGMGTKGASLAPYFAHQLAQHLVNNFPIAPEADVHRFSGILRR